MDSYPYASARDVFTRLYGQLDEVVAELSDQDLLAPSRCRGWVVGDVLAHLHLGIQEVVTAFAYRTGEPPDTSLVSYWRLRLGTDANANPEPALAHARFVRLLSSAYGRPTGLVAHLRPTLDAVLHFVAGIDPADAEQVRFQGQVLPLGDFLVTWVVEAAIHYLDLALELDLPPVPPDALALTSRTLDGLLAPIARPDHWDDVEYALKGAGRLSLTADDLTALGPAAGTFPLLG